MSLKVGEAVVDILITPRLFVYNGVQGVSFALSESASADKTAIGGFGFGFGADILFCGALNHWELSGKAMDEFPLTRIDFHLWASNCKEEYLKVTNEALGLLGLKKDGSESTEGSKKK